MRMGTIGFAVEGRVRWKSHVKEFKQGTSVEKFFTFIIYDESADISIFAVNECCETWFSKIEVGHCYRISRLTPRTASERFNRTGHNCKLQMTKVSLLTSALELRNRE